MTVRGILALLICGLPAWSYAASAADTRPNILFCIGDDFGWPFTGAYGDKVVKTPAFDRVAREGVLFNHAYTAAPSCTPSRASILTGQMFYRLEEGAILWSFLPNKFTVFPDLLEKAGYNVGLMRKGWGPGDYKVGGFTRNPAGTSYKTFAQFLETVPSGQPFFFWFGATDPHRPYEAGSGAASGMKAADVQVPPWLPDTPEVRNDILDYYFEVQRFDREVGEMLALLETKGILENTLVTITGDNGWPFPRAKAYLYDHGVRQPLAVRWGAKVKPGRVVDDFISLSDLAPTFLEAAGLPPAEQMTARSFLNVLLSEKAGRVDPKRDRVVVGLEKHGQLFPMRALRTHEFKYIRNYMPGRYACTDPGPTLEQLKSDPRFADLAQRCLGERPAEELYDMVNDPNEMRNLASDPVHAEVKTRLARELESYLRQTKDPRVLGPGVEKFDAAPRFNAKAAAKKKATPGKKRPRKQAASE